MFYLMKLVKYLFFARLSLIKLRFKINNANILLIFGTAMLVE
jgi:hypothetical protein